MNKKILLGATFAVVFAFTMMANPVFAVSKAFQIDSADGFTMNTVGNIGTATEGHAIIVYAFVTDAVTEDGNVVVYVAAVHPSFNDDDEQTPGNKQIHAHQVGLNPDSLCVEEINGNPSLEKSKKSVTITDTEDENVVAHAIIGYDVTEDGICPTEVYALQPVEIEE
ncbi:MAG: hypothetical protein KGZ34_05365 [Nitrosarchaeum sp.]|nr:hypothetical protein [Nitrosarchaeum sp.]